MAKNTGRGVGTALGTGIGAMFGPAGAGIGASLGASIGGLFDTDDSDEWIQKALAQYEGLVPPDLARAIALTQYQQGGTLTPEQISSLPIEAQQAVKIVESPEMRQKQEVQRQALEQLSRTGMGPQELLALEKVRRTTAADAQSQLESLKNKYQQMGQAGGGASLAASLAATQGASDRAAMEGMTASAQAAENRRAAIKGAMDAASSMRATDLSVAEKNAENERQKQQFDIQNALNRQQWNAKTREEANRLNLARQQDVMDRNVGQQNAELRRQRAAEGETYQNKFQLAQAKAGAYGGRADIEQKRSQAQAQNWQNIAGGIGQGFGAYAKYKQDEEGEDPWSWS